MRTSGQIAQRLKQIRFRYIKRELNNLLQPSPDNCQNHVVVETLYGKMGVCKLDQKTCDKTLEDRSKSCGSLSLKYDEETIKSSLRTFFDTSGLEEIAIRFPEIALLKWVLQDEGSEPLDSLDLDLDLDQSMYMGLGPSRILVPREKDQELLMAYRKLLEGRIIELQAGITELQDSYDKLKSEIDNRIQDSWELPVAVPPTEAPGVGWRFLKWLHSLRS